MSTTTLEANRVYHWKHGWIPLDHTSAGEAGWDNIKTDAGLKSSVGDADDAFEKWVGTHKDWDHKAGRYTWDDPLAESSFRYNRSSHTYINKALRSGDTSLGEREAGIVENLKTGFEGPHVKTVSSESHAFRGVSSEWSKQLSVGDEILDPGFMSVSADLETAKTFGDVQIVVRVPEGTQYLPGSAEEFEMILQPGTQLAVEYISPNGSIVGMSVK